MYTFEHLIFLDLQFGYKSNTQCFFSLGHWAILSVCFSRFLYLGVRHSFSVPTHLQSPLFTLTSARCYDFIHFPKWLFKKHHILCVNLLHSVPLGTGNNTARNDDVFSRKIDLFESFLYMLVLNGGSARELLLVDRNGFCCNSESKDGQ